MNKQYQATIEDSNGISVHLGYFNSLGEANEQEKQAERVVNHWTHEGKITLKCLAELMRLKPLKKTD